MALYTVPLQSGPSVQGKERQGFDGWTVRWIRNWLDAHIERELVKHPGHQSFFLQYSSLFPYQCQKRVPWLHVFLPSKQKQLQVTGSSHLTTIIHYICGNTLTPSHNLLDKKKFFCLQPSWTHQSFCRCSGFSNFHHNIYRGSCHSPSFISLFLTFSHSISMNSSSLFLFFSPNDTSHLSVPYYAQATTVAKAFSPCISHHLEQSSFPALSFCLTTSPFILESHLKTSLLPCLCLLISLSLCYYVLFNFDKYLGIPFVWNKFY